MNAPTAAFASKVDAWLAVLLLGSVVAVLVAVGAAWPRAAAPSAVAVLAATLALGAGLPLWIVASTGYRIEDGELLIRSGPMRWRIPVQNIRRIEASRSWLSSPALSLDRLRIHHCRATGRMRQVLVSPRDRQGFVQALQRLNPNIAVQGL
jgi:membrane protein YdbS with pleckstrin-like domain